MLSPFYKVSSYDTLWHLIGYYLLPSVSINVLATYLTRRADPHPVTIYRWLTIFHLYFLPILPDAYPVIVSFYRLSFPLLTYLVINRYLTRPMIARPQPHARLIHSFEAITFSLAIIFIALVSCQFRYGALVVGSQSMTGTLEQGDLIIYDAKPKHLATGDIVVYRAEKLKIIHRLVGISLIEGQRRYTVQGDANQSPDSVLLTDSDIIGVVRTRLPAFGQPTLYLHEIIESTL